MSSRWVNDGPDRPALAAEREPGREPTTDQVAAGCNNAALTAEDLDGLMPHMRGPVTRLLADTEPLSHREAVDHATELAEREQQPWPILWLLGCRRTLPLPECRRAWDALRAYDGDLPTVPAPRVSA